MGLEIEIVWPTILVFEVQVKVEIEFNFKWTKLNLFGQQFLFEVQVKVEIALALPQGIQVWTSGSQVCTLTCTC